MRLAGAITEGSGAVNEDGFGVIDSGGGVSAAWIFDGVTGINGRNYLSHGSDAQWFVSRAHEKLLKLATADLTLPAILSELVAGLIADWAGVSAGLTLPRDYDPPAACLILAKRYEDGWKALRLGDSCLLARPEEGNSHVAAASPHSVFDAWLSRQPRHRGAAGPLDIKALIAEFRPQLIARRLKRNQSAGYSILEADLAALKMPEYIDLGDPRALLLCTDGFYRAVDHYGLHDDRSLIAACLLRDGVSHVLAALRAVEADDPACEKYIRFKPADDATAVILERDE